MPIALDPSAAFVMEAFKAANRPKLETLSPPEAREASNASRAAVQPEPPELASVDNITVPGPAGAIPVRVYKPKKLAREPAPALIFYHGGGWVICDLDSHDIVCRQMADQGGIMVFSVDYRLAPEHKFPAAPLDCIAATKWIVDNAAKFGIDKERIFAGGDSAGGNLTAVVTIHARDNGGPRIAGQVLVYPATDMGMGLPSATNPDMDVLLSSTLMRWFIDHYLTGKADVDDWRASPLRIKDMKGLPPAYIVTAGADPLYDEGLAYRDRLKGAGIDVAYANYPGQFHGFWTMGKLIPEANKLSSDIAAWLKARI